MISGIEKILDQLPSAVLALGLGFIAFLPSRMLKVDTSFDFLSGSQIVSAVDTRQELEVYNIVFFLIFCYLVGVLCLVISNFARAITDPLHRPRLLKICKMQNEIALSICRSSEKRAEIIAAFGIALGLFFAHIFFLFAAGVHLLWVFLIPVSILPMYAHARLAAFSLRDADYVLAHVNEEIGETSPEAS